MGNGFITPLEMFEAGVKASGILWSTWQQLLADHEKRQEAQLQWAILAPEGANVERIIPRISRVSAATRAFLNHNRTMTFWSFVPAIRDSELTMARSFIRDFQELDHAVQIETGVPLTEWRQPQSFRDELGKVVSGNDMAYQMVAMMPAVPKAVRKPVIQQLCGELRQEHDRHHQRQME